MCLENVAISARADRSGDEAERLRDELQIASVRRLSVSQGIRVVYLVVRDTKLLSAADELPDFLDEGADRTRA
jgi:hypothetical protein